MHDRQDLYLFGIPSETLRRDTVRAVLVAPSSVQSEVLTGGSAIPALNWDPKIV